MTLRGHFFVLLWEFCYDYAYVPHSCPYIMAAHAAHSRPHSDGHRGFYGLVFDCFSGPLYDEASPR